MKTSKIILSVLTVIISCSLACPVFADWVTGVTEVIIIQAIGEHSQIISTTIDGIGQV